MTSSYSVCAIICAAGKGQRAGFDINKMFIPIQPIGESAFSRVLRAFAIPAIDEIIISVSPQDKPIIESFFCNGDDRIAIVEGGEDRSHSVYNALKAAKSDIVLIHDGARPYVTQKVIEDCIHSVKTYGSGVCSIPCRDTIATVKDGKIVNTPPRDSLAQIQTPQGFFRENILYAYERAFELNDRTYTDDSSVFARFCGAPRLCTGARDNIKLTYAEDFSDRYARCGYGVDTHAFGKPQDHIVLAGVKIPSESGLIAHSDGDVLVHAVMDALLSAAGLRDIGYYFPDTDEEWKNADSMQMLATVVKMLREQSFSVKNLSVAIQAEKPRLAKYIEEMRNGLSAVLHVDPITIGIAAGTNEGLGYVGEGKGITVHAYVLLSR